METEAIKRAEQALTDMKEEMQGWLQDELETLQAARKAYFDDTQSKEKRQDLFTCVHDLKGLGTTYDYPLVTRIAGSLSRLMIGVGEDGVVPATLVDAHVDAIRVIVRQNVKDAEDRMGTTLSGELETQVTAHLTADA